MTKKIVDCATVVVAVSLLVPAVMADLSPEQEARYHNLLEELRCLVCQNQTLAESSAGLAGDLRERVLQMLKEGASDEAILLFMTERYGDFVRYRPPFDSRTWLLWLMPPLLLAGLLFALLRFVLAQGKSRSKEVQ